MIESSDTISIKPNHGTDDVTVENTVSNPIGKRPLDESEEDCETKSKLCKTEESNADPPTMSKKQIKKMQKQQMWLDKKEKRKEANKEKKLELKKWKAQMKESGMKIEKVKRYTMAKSTCKQRIVLDMSYDHLMSDKDLSKCSNQILRCYGVNRRMNNPMQLYFCSYEGKIKEIMNKHNGSESWDIKYLENSFHEVFQKKEMIYLTSDSDNVLESLDDKKVYIIGGLVDHNSCKGVSLKVANELGVDHARLPIDEHITMQTSKILTINHVFEIISKVVSGMSWKDALTSTMPKRKMFLVKGEEHCLDNENDCSDYNTKEEIECPIAETNGNAVEQKISVGCLDNDSCSTAYKSKEETESPTAEKNENSVEQNVSVEN